MDGVSNNSYIDSMRWRREEGAEAADPSEQQKLEQEDFFKLLTEQLNMQDPTKPVDNDQMISQMTSFSMAEGISQLSSQFTQFTQNMSSNQALQASTMVGRDVLVWLCICLFACLSVCQFGSLLVCLFIRLRV